MIAPAARWPGAVQRPVSYAGQAGTIAPLGWVLHVVVGNGSPWATFEQAPAGRRRFSHLWVSKDGRAEQYASLWRASWAQGDGNNTYWSVETEGMPDEPLTDAQVHTLAAFHAWSGTVDALASSPGEAGIGTHQMGGAAWGGHTCPDPAMGLPGPRSRQRQAILDGAATIRNGGTTVTPAEIDAVATKVVERLLATVVGDPKQPGSVKVAVALQRAGNGIPDLQETLAKGQNVSVDLSAASSVIAAAVIAALPAGQAFTADELATAVADKLAARLTS